MVIQNDDIEETDIVAGTDEVNYVFQVSDRVKMSRQNLQMWSVIRYTENPTYASTDGTLWVKIPLTMKRKRRKCNVQKVSIGLTKYSCQFSTIKEAFKFFFPQNIIDVILLETKYLWFVYYFLSLARSYKTNICIMEPRSNFKLTLVLSTMSRNRFQQILRFLRFDNFETKEERKYARKSKMFLVVLYQIPRNLYFHLNTCAWMSS